MQAGDVKLGKIFANDHQSVIPIFQRPYVWDREDNWEPLWKDVRTAAEEVEALSAPEELGEQWSTDRWVAHWDEDRIRLRTLWLAGIALQAWPGPEGDID